jgi:hypothetical protein
MSPELRQAWMSHLCGLCLTLRDRHGQWARLATNVDAVLVSALVAAQAAPAHPAGGPGRARRLAGPCPLRGMRRIEVDIADEAAPRLAAAVSLAAGATSVRDHVADGDGLLRLRTAAALARRVAGHAAGAAGREGRGVGLDVGLFERAAAAGRAREHAPATGGGREALLAALAPTEASTSAVLAHTAVLAGTSGRAGNEAHLGTVGGRFGRIVHLLDAVTDQKQDARAGAWNPLTATGTTLDEARRLCDDSHHDLRHALAAVDLAEGVDARLVRALLDDGVAHAIDRAFLTATAPPDRHGRTGGLVGRRTRGAGRGTPARGPGRHPDDERDRRRVTGGACLAATGMFLTCQMCGDYTSPFDGQRKEGLCGRCDGCDDCCDCCDCCECCECCGACG